MAQFPTVVPTNADLKIAVNNLLTTLDGAHDASITTITVASTTGFPTAGFITIGTEAIEYTGTTSTTFTGATRGADGTTATSHADLDQVAHNVVAAHHNELKDEIIAIAQNISDRFGLGSTDVKIPALTKLFFDGGTNIFIQGLVANRMSFFSNNVETFRIQDGNFVACQAGVDFSIQALKKIFLDGGGDTFFQENPGNSVVAVAGATTAIAWDNDNTSGNTRFLIRDNDNATLERVTVGIADSGGSGFKVLRIPN